MNILTTWKHWYERRVTRERILLLLLSIAVYYFIFYVFVFRYLSAAEITKLAAITEADKKLNTIQTQLSVLKKIDETPLFHVWLKEQETQKKLQAAYQALLQSSSSQQMQEIVKKILSSDHQITILQIKNAPEAPYAGTGTETEQATKKIYEQKITVVISANYVTTQHYLAYLEEKLLNVRWNSLNYQVIEYPTAKVEMEFSLFYEKAN